MFPEAWLRRAIGRSGRLMLGRNLPDLRELAEVGKILAWLGFARPLPRHVDSRPPGPAFDAFPTSAKPPRGKSAAQPPRRLPAAYPTPDLREASERKVFQPTSEKKGGRENSWRANPSSPWASCSLGLETGHPFLKTGFPFLKYMPRF